MHSSRILLAESTALSHPGLIRARATDAMQTIDRATIDGSGVFLIGELERLDMTPHEPLVQTSWARDIDLREDITIADEVASWTNMSFATPGGIQPTGKSWASKEATALTGPAIDLGKTAQPLHLWAEELSYSVVELAQSQKLNRPIDAAKYDAIMLKYDMDTDEQTYIGDAYLPNCYGLTNNPAVTPVAAAAGAAGGTTWASKTPQEMLRDVNAAIQSAWLATGYKFPPRKVLLPPTQFGLLATQVNSSAGVQTILTFLKMANIATQQLGVDLEILPLKWLTGRGTGGTDRMVVYTQDPNLLVLPRTELIRGMPEYRSLWYHTSYYSRLGQVEFHYTEPFGYIDGI